MVRVALKSGDKISVANTEYIIDSVVGDGATCIVYSARYIDHAGLCHSVLLKECYPYADNVSRDGKILLWADENEHQNSLSSFKSAYEKLMAMQNTAKLRNSTSHAFDLFEGNETLYSVTDITEGTTFEKDKSKGLSDILKTALALSKVVGKYHNAGYLHLDIKPSNFLVIPETRELVVLFDVDSVTSMDDIKNGKIKCIPYSKGWAAPEQMQGQIAKLCPATDIYSIGAILFQKLFNRDIAPADIGVFADWDFEDTTFDSVNPKIKRLLRTIFRKTLSANIKRRYQSADELIATLEEAVEVAEQKTYLLSDYIVSDINFVGRKNDLLKLDELFDNGTKAVFLHGFGGVGKTALATKYAELYGNKYDCIKFCRYSNGLKQIIDSLEIANAFTNGSDEHRKLLKTVLKDTKTLIIIDNFDVEDDEELEYLLSLNCNVLFTTRNDYSQYASSEKLEIIELESLPTDALVQVFKNEYGRDITVREEELVQVIIEKFGNLTLIVPMIAKQILSSHISIEEFASSIEGDVFARFNEDNEDIRIRKDGKSHKTNSLDYLRAMFNIAALSDEQKTVLQYLYLLRYHNDLALTTEKYKECTDTNNLNALNDLAFKNWITIEHNELKDEDHIMVHQLIYDLVEKDFYPTYESVPGITKHIEDCFKVLEDMMILEQSISDTVIDWESAKCITFALLMYDDIRRSESKEACSKKMDILYGFMCIAFLEDAYKLYELLFKSPEESTYYFYVSGIMDWFDFAGKHFKEIDRLQNWSKSLEKEGLSFEFSDGTKVEFDTNKEKNEFIEYIANEEKKACDDLLTYSIAQIPYFVMSYYFFSMDAQMNIAHKNVNFLRLAEEQLSQPGMVNIEYGNMSASDFILYRLDWYLTICSKPKYNKDAERQTAKGINNATNYEFYCLTYELLKQALQLDIDDEKRKNYKEKAEEIYILLEEVNDKFAWYGLTEQEILEYTPASFEEYNVNKASHWTKKANKWYDSVEKTLMNTDSPYAIYKLLLTFDYHNTILNNSKITKLISFDLVNRICEDNRLTYQQKQELLLGHIYVQSRFLRVGKRKLLGFTKKHLPTLDLYFECLLKAEFLLPELKTHILTNKITALLESAYILRRFLKKEIFDLDSYIESCITPINIKFIDELIYFADKVRMSGYIKKSQQLKHKILDLCLDVDFHDLKEETIQLILYKARPLAVNYKREDVVSKIDTIDVNVERKYHLSLVNYPSIAIKPLDCCSIACKFLDDYIEAVAIEAYNQIHNGLPVEYLDEMEQALIKYLDCLLLVADLSDHNYYNPIFGDKTAFDKTIEDGFVRQLCPFWISQFYSSGNPHVDIGICYLIAQTYDSIPMDGKLACALETVIDYDESENDYQLPQETIQEMLDNIVKICPKAKKDIDSYFRKN